MTRTPFSPKHPNRRGFIRGLVAFRHDPNGSDMAAVWGDSEDGCDLIAKIKDTPVACVQTENQFIFYL